MKEILKRSGIVIFLMMFCHSASADPYICATLTGGGGCYMKSVTNPIYLCEGEVVKLYARPEGHVFPPPSPCDNASYQWRRYVPDQYNILRAVDIDYANYNTITLGTTGIYDCVVRCSDRTYETSTVFIYVTDSQENLQFNSQPGDAEICLGDYAVFSASATGGYIKYQWQELEPLGTWTTISGEKTKDFVFYPELGDSQNQYRCVVSNGCESLTSSSGTLSVYDSTLIELEPVADSVCEATAAGFSVSVRGNSLSFEWEERTSDTAQWASLSSSGNYEFDQSGNFTIKAAMASMTGNHYRAIVSGVCPPGDTSLTASLYIKPPPAVQVQPSNDTSCFEGSAYFEVSAGGTVPLAYKWLKGGKTVKDWSDENYLELHETTLDDNQDIQVLISDHCFSHANAIPSDIAKLVVNPPPFVNLGEDRRICSGSDAVLNAGSGFMAYAWSNGDSTQTTDVSQQGSYSVSVTDRNGCTGEDLVYIFVDPPVSPLSLGTDTILCGGSELTLDAGQDYDWYEWSDGSQDQKLRISETGGYWVRAGLNNTICETRDTVKLLIAEPYDSHNICLITIDQSTGQFMLIWERTAGRGIAAYNIYREGNHVGTVAFDDLSIFKDPEADPEKRPYRYEMSIIDTCGNESGFTPYHIPIFLQYNGYIEGVNLQWEKYQVEGSPVDFGSYSVYKGSDSTQLTPIEENIPPEVSVFIDRDPAALSNTYYYRVAGVLSEPCNASGGSTKAGAGPYGHSLSNLDKFIPDPSGHRVNEESGIPFIWPNPATETVTVRLEQSNSSDNELLITDMSGKVLRSFRDITGEEFRFSVIDLPAGIYTVLFKGQGIIRGKLVVK